MPYAKRQWKKNKQKEESLTTKKKRIRVEGEKQTKEKLNFDRKYKV